jgi:hypothetical protein
MMRKLSLLMTARELLPVLKRGGLPYKVVNKAVNRGIQEQIPAELIQNVFGRRLSGDAKIIAAKSKLESVAEIATANLEAATAANKGNEELSE